MNTSYFLSTVVQHLRDRYLSLARYGLEQGNTQTTTPAAPEEETAAPETVDRYEPSVPVDSEKAPLPSMTPDVPPPQGEMPTEEPEAIYYYRRQARLDYKLDLRFDLNAVVQTARQLANEETPMLDQFAAAGFGLSTDFAVSGKQTVDSYDSTREAGGNTHARESVSAKSKQAGSLQVRDRDFALQSFYREAVKVRRSIDVKEHGHHQRTVNKFALRFHVDNRFSFAFADRFHAQTRRVAAQCPDHMGSYLDTAGGVALQGTSEMMATFFDTVDGYLSETEENLLRSIVASFDAAAEELGFAGAHVDLVREQLTESIETFFDRVGSVLDAVESRFVPARTEVETVPEPAESLPADYTSPAVAEDKGLLTVA
ncbi:MAG TPA: hypothetical protein VMY05_00685 [Acidobacteriota bacterium]|nr:hypothetical protein [Acidobacteriota bacterium]